MASSEPGAGEGAEGGVTPPAMGLPTTSWVVEFILRGDGVNPPLGWCSLFVSCLIICLDCAEVVIISGSFFGSNFERQS